MRLLFVGDVMLGRLVNQVLQREGPAYPWGSALHIIRAADWRVCNLECVISDLGEPWSVTPKVFHFRSDAKNIAVLQAAALDAVSLANNHVLDYEYEAFVQMLRILNGSGIVHAGAGLTAVEAARCAVSTVGGLRVGMMAFTDNEPGWEATPVMPGVLYVPIDHHDKRADALFSAIRLAKLQVDLLVVSAHWGPNWGRRPLSEQVDFGHALIDVGADIVFGHSCHVFQGIEWYRDRLILYSTGDFIDDYAVDEVERNDESFIFVVETEQAELKKVRLYPTLIEGCQATLAGYHDATRIAEEMETLCRELGTPTQWIERERCLEVGSVYSKIA
ncbi:MAG TPA: CapA family protein [Tepidisphaeraceae bacterium]|nr:CapA family protein [Tepidisphaeraceae bacterium]